MHHESISLKKHKKIKDSFDTRAKVDEILIDEIIIKILSLLSPREALVLRLRLLEDMKFNSIAKIVGVGPQRVSQIYSKALRKLRHPSRAEIVLKYLDNERLDHYIEQRKREAAEWAEKQRIDHEQWIEKCRLERESRFIIKQRVESVLVEVKPIDPQEECVYNWVRQMAMPYFQK